MKKVTLYFPDIYLLWAFARTLDKAEINVDSAKRTLTCNCNEERITDALVNFKARLVDAEIIK